MELSRTRLAGFAILFVVTILASLLVTGFLSKPAPSAEKRFVVIRVDDIQDYAFAEGQHFLLNYSAESSIPLSLSVIAGEFGSDKRIVDGLRSALNSGCEVTIHGWQHENLSSFSVVEQTRLLFESKSRLKELLNVTASVLVPPTFGFNNDTLKAMKVEGLTIISTISEFSDEKILSGVLNIPATVELSVLANGVWKIKSVDSLAEEIEKSLGFYGYAVIVTHPQEFMSNGTMNQATTESYVRLLKKIGKTCQFTTFENLSLRK